MDEQKTPVGVKPITPAEIRAPKLSENERRARASDIQTLETMRTDRDAPHPELDEMTYVQYYESNRKKDLSHIPRKRNKQDVRIPSGLTREKDTTLLSTCLSMNFVPDITAFDTDDLMINELGDHLADLNKKSREIEDWQRKRPIIYREMISQGDVFVQEVHVQDFRMMPLEQIEWDPTTDKIGSFKEYKMRLKKVFDGCAVRMVNGKKVYLGNIRLPYIEDQDVVAILNVYNRSTAYGTYGAWERWENVPTQIDTVGFDDSMLGETYKTWNILNLSNQNQVAEIMLFNKRTNRFQIYLNGTPMLPYNFPLTVISPSGEIPISQGKLEGISDFAYSKSQPAKTKIDDEVLSEATKLMVEGMRQGRKPPMGNTSRKVLSSTIMMAGKITPDIKEGQLFPLLQNPGLNASDFSFYQLIKQGIDDKTVNASYEGNGQTGDPTATQVQQEKQQQMLKLGLALDGVVNLERRMTWLRTYNILQHWTKKYDPHMDKDREQLFGEYRKFSVDTTLSGGQRGVKLIRFKTDGFPPLHEQHAEERQLSEQYHREVRIAYLNPELLRTMKTKLFIVINPTPSSNDVLTQIVFIQNVRQAMEIFGPEALNQDYIKQRFAIIINEDYNKFFKKMDIMQMLQMGMGGSPDGNTNGAANGMRGGAESAAGKRKQPIRAAVQ